MNEQEVKALMASSRSEKDWDLNCDKVKFVFGDYPPFWHSAIIASGLWDATRSRGGW